MIEGIFVLFQDTGNLAPTKARALTAKCKKNILDLEDKFPNWRIMAIPCRSPQETELRAIKLTKKGVIVFYINIGSRSPSAAESFIEKIRKEHSWLSDLPQSTMFIPIRNQNTYVDYLNLEEESNVTSKNQRT